MPRPEKVDKVDELSEKLSRAQGIYFTDFHGMSVELIGDLRRQFYQESVDFHVVKNTLCRLSVNKVGLSVDEQFLQGPTALALAYENPVAPAKIVKNFRKKNKIEKPAIKGIVFEGSIIPAEGADAIADLPSREELLAKLLAVLNAPMSNFVGVLSATMQKLLGVLNSLKDKKS